MAMSSAALPMKRRIVIGGFAVPELPRDYFAAMFARVEATVTSIYTGKPLDPSTTLEELYRGVETLCQYRHAEELYTRLRARLAALIDTAVSNVARDTSKTVGVIDSDAAAVQFLAILARCWESHCKKVSLIRNVLLYLDRTYAITGGTNASFTPFDQPQQHNSRFNVAVSVTKESQQPSSQQRHRQQHKKNTAGQQQQHTSSAQDSAVMSIWDTALCLFRDAVSKRSGFWQNAVRGVLAIVAADRRRVAFDEPLVVSAVTMFSVTGMYEDVFEAQLLGAAKDFYRAEAAALLQADLSVGVVGGYLRLVDDRIHQESTRCMSYLLARSRKPLVSIVEREMFYNHLDTLLGQSGLHAFLHAVARPNGTRNADITDSLRLVYMLGKKTDTLQQVKQAFVQCVTGIAREITQGQKSETDLVVELLRLKRAMEGVVRGPFENAQLFSEGLRFALETGINENQFKPAEFLAKFVDLLLRTAGKSTASTAASGATKAPDATAAAAAAAPADAAAVSAPAEGGGGGGNAESMAFDAAGCQSMDALMDALIGLFRLLQSKDVFEAYYNKFLANRLLQGNSASMVNEQLMVAKLKAECGSSFTSKLEGMFKDVETSQEISTKFRVESGVVLPFSFVVCTLTSTFWPSYPELSMVLPDDMARAETEFKRFYSRSQPNRTLTFQHALGSAMLRADYRAGRKELVVTLPQAIVLLAFSECREGATAPLPFAQIKARTGMPVKELRVTLHSLCLGKYRPLARVGGGRGSVLETDAFDVDYAFTSKRHRLKIPAMRPKEDSAADDRKVREAVAVDRSLQIEAAVVRIMKARKKLAHTELLHELAAQLRFPVLPADVNPRVDSLVARDFLSRDPQDPQTLHYLA